ncbi:MAG: hypothetical protein ACQEQV_04485 [Fibrobacterota bacterium]
MRLQSVCLLFLLISGGATFCREIVFEGLSRTRPARLRSLLQIRGDSLGMPRDSALVRSRLLKSGIVSDISFEYDSAKNLWTVQVQERWTLRPVVSLSLADTALFYSVGAYDINLFGAGVRAGAIMDNYTGRLNGRGWCEVPRPGGLAWNVRGEGSSLRRLRNWYTPDGRLQGGFRQQRDYAGLSVLIPLRRREEYLTIQGALRRETYDTLGLSGDVSAANSTGLDFTGEFTRWWVLGGYRMDRTRVDGFLRRGWITSVTGTVNASAKGPFVTAFAGGQYYYPLPSRGTILLHGAAGLTTSDFFGSQFYLGGVSALRGVGPLSLRAKSYGRINLELQKNIRIRDLLVIQPAFFCDVLGLCMDDQAGQNTGGFTGIGAGIRFFFPRIYGVHISFDYAFVGGSRRDQGFFLSGNRFIPVLY